MNKKPTKINLTSDDSLFEKSLNLQKYIEDLSSQAVNLTDKFSFTWAGKSNAIKSVLVPSKLTLNPEPEQSIKWDQSENLFIEGDNLEVLKLLQKAYFEKVKMIYIDPPYNTGHDFVYNDNFSAPLDNYLKQTGQKTETGESATTNKETNGRYHSDWLSMMYPRLKLAWNLLREDGVIFVSIDDNEVHHLRMLLDEVFGEENFVANLTIQGYANESNEGVMFQNVTEYCLCYSKNKIKAVINKIDAVNDDWRSLNDAPSGLSTRKQMGYSIYYNKDTKDVIPKIDYNPEGDLTSFENLYHDDEKLLKDGYVAIRPMPRNGTPWRWRWGMDTLLERINELRFRQNRTGAWTVEFGQSGFNAPRDYQEFGTGTIEVKRIFDGKELFSKPKSTELLNWLLQVSTSEDDIILDFFAGSGTTGHAVLKLNQDDKGNRKFICVQLPEKLDEKSEGFKAGYKTIADIAKERIRRVIKGYGENPQPIDAGFKVFTLSESNYPENTFVFNPEKSSEENQQAFIDYLNKAKQSQLFDKENDTSLVYENIVKEGLSLNSKVEIISIGKNNFYKVTDGEQQLLVCLENKLASETVKELTDKSHKDKLFICLESALDDTTAANLSLNLDLKTI